MILEVAILNVKEGKEIEFEKDFETAGQYISSIKGYKGHSCSSRGFGSCRSFCHYSGHNRVA